MKRTTLWFGVGALVVMSGGSFSWADQTTPVHGLHHYDPNYIAITNATIIPEPGKKIEQATLVIENGLIKSVSKGARAPVGARVIDATGYMIYPGFIDAFSNYAVTQPEKTAPLTRGQMPQYSNAREGGNASNAAIHAEKSWYESVQPNQRDAKGYIDLGFTSVQTARLDGIFRGRAATVSLANKIPNDIIYLPQSRHFASFDKGSSKQQYPSSLMGSVALIRQALSDAAWYKEAYGLKSHLGGAVEYNAALAALAGVSQEGVVFEASDELNALRAARVFKEFSVPLTIVGSGFEYTRLAEIAQSDAQFILPLNFPAAPALNEPYAELDVPLADLRHWERAPGNLAAVSKAGITFAITTHGLDKKASFWPNLRKAIRHGLSKDTALAALTTVPAEIAGVASQVGRLQPGYRADFVISRGDLFESGELISVWLQGEEQTLQEMHPAQFAGQYHFTLFGQQAQFDLAGMQALKGTLSVGETEVKVRNLSSSADKVQFVVDLTSVGGIGTYRGQLSQDSQQSFSLKLVDTQGQFITLTASRETSSTPQATQEDSKAVEYVSRLSWPNTGYGRLQKPQQQNVHFKNATIWTADEKGVLQESDLIIRNGLIAQIGQNLKTPRGYHVVDATGLHITPGIIDEHSHIAISQGVNEGTEAVTAEAHIGDVVNPDDIHIYRSLAGGVTVAHLLHGSANPIGATGQAIKLRWGEGAEGLKFKEVPPTIKMALGENVKQSNWGDMNRIRYPQTRMGVASIMRDYFQQAREYEAAKTKYARLSRSERRKTAPPRTDYRMETLLQIINNERFTHVHSYVASEILALMDVVEQLGFRIHTFTHVLEGYKVADEIKAHGARASTFADWWAYKFEAYDAVSQNACLMMEKGVLTTVNSDSNDLQRRLNTEAAKSVRYCGMPEEEALKMVTLYPAMQLEVADYVGSLVVGKQADLAIWNNHPLSAYAQVQQTWIEGHKYFDREEDRQRRAEIEKERAQLVELVLQQGASAQQGAQGVYKQPQPTWHCEDNQDVWRLQELSQSVLMSELGGF